jgi:cytochrome c peroxidase
MDQRTWLGFPDGPRNTPSLFGVGNTLPIHWSGDLDELQDVELTIRDIQFGNGLIKGPVFDSLGQAHSQQSADLDALAAYMNSLEVPPSPYQFLENDLESGKFIFNENGCDSCHAPPFFTDFQLHDVGTGDIDLEKNSHDRGTSFDTPSLLGIWATAPYFHDGSGVSLHDVLKIGNTHNISDKISDDDLDALINYLMSLGY